MVSKLIKSEVYFMLTATNDFIIPDYGKMCSQPRKLPTEQNLQNNKSHLRISRGSINHPTTSSGSRLRQSTAESNKNISEQPTEYMNVASFKVSMDKNFKQKLRSQKKDVAS